MLSSRYNVKSLALSSFDLYQLVLCVFPCWCIFVQHLLLFLYSLHQIHVCLYNKFLWIYYNRLILTDHISSKFISTNGKVIVEEGCCGGGLQCLSLNSLSLSLSPVRYFIRDTGTGIKRWGGMGWDGSLQFMIAWTTMESYVHFVVTPPWLLHQTLSCTTAFSFWCVFYVAQHNWNEIVFAFIQGIIMVVGLLSLSK